MNSEVQEIIPSTSMDCEKINSSNGTKVLPTVTQLMTFPESVVHQIFAYLNHSEVLQAQRVNKHFHKLIIRNSHLLSRPEIIEMGISMCSCEKRTKPFGRLQGSSSILKPSRRRRLLVRFVRKTKTAVKCKEVFEDEDFTGDRNELSQSLLNYLDQHFKTVYINGTLSFSGIALNSNLYKILCKSWVRITDATRLVFTLCRFRLSSKYFYELLTRTRCRKLTIELSHFEQFVLDDLVLQAMPECEELILSSTIPVYFTRITDSSLHRWAVQENLPRKILFRNIQANFTFDGVITLINALQIRHPELFSDTFQDLSNTDSREKIKYDWDFGCVPLPEENQNNSIIELLSTPGVVAHVSRPSSLANVIDVVVNSKDLLQSSTKCQLLLRLQLVLPTQKAMQISPD
ncbi:unnamed protein product [Thelazia callipaeda]|uniref:F-box domain-containing protein n=1 Tax=Thelazia callipaeda TaxID=103827 RepID=A0A0N5CN74_THECL|nr:unnamed protein product [Thelazia callipaeda]